MRKFFTECMLIPLLFALSCNNSQISIPPPGCDSVAQAQHTTIIKSDSIQISICDVPKIFFDTPVLNITFTTPMFSDLVGIRSFVKRRLNNDEKKYLRQHPVNSINGFFCALGAELLTSGIEGRRDGKADALRHGFWGACMTDIIGEEEAKKILDNHESGSANTMDANNNKTAIAIGLKMKGASLADIWSEVVHSYERGDLKSDVPPPAKTDMVPRTPPVVHGPMSSGGGEGGFGRERNIGSNSSVKDFVRDASRQAEKNGLSIGEVIITEQDGSGKLVTIRFKVQQQ